MAGAKRVAHLLVVVGVLIAVVYQKTDGLARRHSVKHAAQYLHLVCFLSGSDKSALPGTATVEFALYEVDIYPDTCRHTVDDTANGGAVALAEGGQAEDMAKTVSHINDSVRNRSGRRGGDDGDVRHRSPHSPRSHSRNHLRP